MKNVFRWTLICLVGALVILSSCEDRCEGVVSERIGQEYFSVIYQDASGANSLEGRFNLNNVEVFIDSSGGEGEPQFYRLQEDLADGVFGPFYYMDDYLDPATRKPYVSLFANRPIRFDYYFRKDTFGIDTLQLSYFVEADDCGNRWTYIYYALNGDTLSQYTGQKEAEIVIVE